MFNYYEIEISGKYVKNLFSTIKLILSDITIITDIMTKAK